MKEDLKFVFTSINDWLKFAEAKVAGLLVLNGACIIGIIQANSIFENSAMCFSRIMILIFCLSSCICLYSILPILNKWFRFYKKMDEEEFKNAKSSINHLFFVDISKLSAEQYGEVCNIKYGTTANTAEKDFFNQITNNAEIAVQKYACFKFAGWLSFSAFLIGALLAMLNVFS